MGGQGSGRPPSMQTIVERTKPREIPIGDGIYLPNYSGDHSAGLVNRTPTNDTDIANKKYVDDSIIAIGSTLSTILPGSDGYTGATNTAFIVTPGSFSGSQVGNAGSGTLRWTTQVPAGATGISSITIKSYTLTAEINKNFWMQIGTSTIANGGTITTDNGVAQTFGSGANANSENDITVPATSYDGQTITAGKLFGISIFRDPANVADDYNNNFIVFEIVIVWS